MSKRGNPDYFKTAGHAAEDPDTGEQAKRHFGESRRVSLRGATEWMRPQRPMKTITPPPVHDGDLPWRVTRRSEARPPLRPKFEIVPSETPAPSWQKRVIRLAVRAVLSPAHVALSIADALVERALWRLEQQI
jgi:hypothetical protein